MYYLGSTVLRLNSPFTISGTQYPSNWLTVSTEADRTSLGITWVADPVRADDRFYWNGDATLPKALEDIGKKVRTMPQIKIDGELMGGYNQLVEYFTDKGRVNFKGEII